jgi:hypothetical protein
MATSTYSAAEIELRRKLLLEQLGELQDEKLKSIGNMQIIDFHHPERSPGWPVYRFQAYPQLMYHPTEKEPGNEAKRLGVRRRNEQNPHLAPMDIPESIPLQVKVADAEEKKRAIARGFVDKPPERQMIDGNSPLEVIGSASENPLMAPASALSIETILELNSMPKAELVKHASQVYGVVLPDEATKVDFISAIQKGVQDGAISA